MQQQPSPMFKEPPFGVLQSSIEGLRAVWVHRRMFVILSIVPFALTFITLLIGRHLNFGGVFFAPVLQFPASVMLGVQCAVILRFLVLGEFPVIADDAIRRKRNEMIMQAGLVYGAVQFFIAGAFAGMLILSPLMQSDPEAMAPYMPFLMAALVLMIWAMRWLWLYVPVAMGWQSQGFFTKLGRWAGSFRVFGVYLLCSAVVNMVVSVVIQVLRGAAGAEMNERLSGAPAVVVDGVIAAGTVAAGIVFAAATAIAVLGMLKGARIKVDA